jgi:hypothetical protein
MGGTPLIGKPKYYLALLLFSCEAQHTFPALRKHGHEHPESSWQPLGIDPMASRFPLTDFTEQAKEPWTS